MLKSDVSWWVTVEAARERKGGEDWEGRRRAAGGDGQQHKLKLTLRVRFYPEPEAARPLTSVLCRINGLLENSFWL